MDAGAVIQNNTTTDREVLGATLLLSTYNILTVKSHSLKHYATQINKD